MLDTINQDLKNKLYEEHKIGCYKNPDTENREIEVIIIITPSKNYFRVDPYNKFESRVFEKFEDANKYVDSILINYYDK